MQLAESELLETSSQNFERTGEVFAARCARLERLTLRSKAPTLGSIGALLFVAADNKVACPSPAIATLASIVEQERLASDELLAQVRTLLPPWLAQMESDPAVCYRKWLIASRSNLQQPAMALARQLLALPVAAGQEPLVREQQANFLSAMGRWSEPEYVTLVEPLLEVATPIQKASDGQPEIQLRDVAIAALAHISTGIRVMGSFIGLPLILIATTTGLGRWQNGESILSCLPRKPTLLATNTPNL